MLEKLPNESGDGVLTLKRIRELPGYPGEERFERGPVHQYLSGTVYVCGA
jgi:hypothetical protein